MDEGPTAVVHFEDGASFTSALPTRGRPDAELPDSGMDKPERFAAKNRGMRRAANNGRAPNRDARVGGASFSRVPVQ